VNPRISLPLDVPRRELLTRAAEVIADAWRSFDSARPAEPPVSDALRALALEGLSEQPSSALEVLETAKRFLDTSVAQARPRYFAFIGSSGLEVGVLADALASTFDVNLATTARSADLIENQALRFVAELFGYPFSGGAFTSGGMVSNLTALTAARERALPDARRTGLNGRPAALYCSSEAHYSVRRAAEVLGIGADFVRGLPMDAQHRVQADAIADAIDADLEAGITPVAVVATAGTTLTGAIDPIAALADICAARGVWLHVDGAYGLPGAAVHEVRPRFAGLERADSISVDAHKWLYLPKACGVVLVKDRHTLTAAFSHNESYMLHDDSQPLNFVDSTLEYSRPFRALKLWMALRVHGAAQFRAAIRRNLEQAQLCANLVRTASDLELLTEPQLSTVPYRHVPDALRGNETALNRHNLELVRAMQDDGRVYISSALVDGKHCLRPCFVNFRTSDDDVSVLIDVTRELGSRLVQDGVGA
jgi:aromatic-L-amino-acid/L-tryptophan decarboxylase